VGGGAAAARVSSSPQPFPFPFPFPLPLPLPKLGVAPQPRFQSSPPHPLPFPLPLPWGFDHLPQWARGPSGIKVQGGPQHTNNCALEGGGICARPGIWVEVAWGGGGGGRGAVVLGQNVIRGSDRGAKLWRCDRRDCVDSRDGSQN